MQFGTIFNGALLFAIVLIFGALSGYFSERVGIANISIDGQMIFGALTFCIISELIYPIAGEGSFLLPILISMILTILASSIFAFLTITLKTNQVVAGTAINIAFLGLATFLTEPLGPLLSNGKHTKLQSEYLGFLDINNSQIFLTTIILFSLTIAIIVGLYIMVKCTPFGLRLRAIGNNPNAVDSQGINVTKYQWIALTISGMLAGLSGAVYMYTQGGTFSGSVNGFGFLSLAILIAGSWKIPLLAVIATVFAFLTKLFAQLEITVDLQKDVAKMIPFLITFVAVICFSKYNAAPKNIGIPFDKSKR